jgi:hypothetical protein
MRAEAAARFSRWFPVYKEERNIALFLESARVRA